MTQCERILRHINDYGKNRYEEPVHYSRYFMARRE